MRRIVARLVVMLTWFLAGGSVRRAAGFTPDAKQRIYFANHSSHLDFVIIWAALPAALRLTTRPVAAKDYWDKSALRRYLARSVFNAVLIERNREAAAANPMETLQQGLGDAHSLILFPEGTRGDGVTMGPFKSGIYRLALARPDVELIPVYIENLNRILPKGEFLPVPMLSAITFGAPMHVLDGETKFDFLDRAKNALLELRR
jgi:1-acyl-sn-glycerol-3-phosphate acyltransferase